MANHDNDPQESWYRGKITRRRWLGLGATAAGAIGAGMLVPAPWRAAFGQAKPFKIGTLQPLSGTAAAGGKTALVGVQMAVDRINKAGGVNGRPIELIVADYESKPDVGRRKAEKLVLEDKIDAHVGGYLSNVCLACMPVYEEHKLVNMIGVCLDTTITTSKCSRYTFRPFDFAPSQAVAIAPYLVNKVGKKWHIAYADYAWGQSTRDAYAAGDQEAGRRGHRHHRRPPQHRGHDRVPQQDQRAPTTASSASSSARRASRSSTRASTWASPRRPGSRATAPSWCPPAFPRWAPRPTASWASTATCRSSKACSTPPTTSDSSTSRWPG